jgi:hypothetical protein
MPAMKSGRPFSITYKAARGSAGGMTISRAITEGEDNTFDEKGKNHYSALFDVAGVPIFFELNDARGLTKIPHIYGIAEETPVKGDKEDSGIFNSGHTAKTAFIDPTMVYSESAYDGTMNNLTFEAEKFVNAYEANPEDMSAVDITNFMSCSRPNDRGMYINKTMEEICEKISEPNVKELLTAVLKSKQPNYMLHIYFLRKDKRLSPTHFRDFMPAFAMIYYSKLVSGATIIHLLDDSKKPAENVLRYTATNAIDPLYNRDMFPVLVANVEIRKRTEGGSSYSMAKIELYNEKDPAVKGIIYVSASADGRRHGAYEPQSREPSHWEKGVPHLKLTYKMNILSENAGQELYKKLGGGEKGSDFKGIDSLRGINLIWAYRQLGSPYWKKGGQEKWGFGDMRNIRFARCTLEAEGLNPDSRQAKMDAVDSLGIQSNKHNCDLDNCEEIIRFLNALIYGTLTHAYSHCNTGLERDGMTKPWDLDEFEREMNAIWGSKAQKNAVKNASKADHDACLKSAGGSGTRAAGHGHLPAVHPMPAPISRLATMTPVPAPASPAATTRPITPPTSVTQSSSSLIPQHSRLNSKSPQDILRKIAEFGEKISNSNIGDIIPNASLTNEKGLTALYKALATLDAFAESHGVKNNENA